MNERNLKDLDPNSPRQDQPAYEPPKVESFDLNQVVRFRPGSQADGFGGFLG